MSIFGKIHENYANAVRVAYEGDSVQVTPEKISPATKVESVEEAEKMLLDMAPVWEVDGISSPMGKRVSILRAANSIANQTRRGAGNLVLVSQDDDWETLSAQFNYVEFSDHPEVESGTAYVMYRTDNDGPAFLISKDDDLYFSPLEESGEFLGKAEDYLIKIDWRNQQS